MSRRFSFTTQSKATSGQSNELLLFNATKLVTCGTLKRPSTIFAPSLRFSRRFGNITTMAWWDTVYLNEGEYGNMGKNRGLSSVEGASTDGKELCTLLKGQL